MAIKDTLGFAEAARPLRTPVSPGDGAAEPDVEALRESARIVARMEVADAVSAALEAYQGSLRDLQKASGLDPAFVSKLASGKVNKQGATVASLAQIALAMNKTLKITIE